jgi:hypothetical protein
MEAAPGAFDNAKPFHLEFGVSESSKEGTDELPVLYYERNGFRFRATLDLIANAARIEVIETRIDSFESDANLLMREVQSLATIELEQRREQYGTEHFS